MKCPMCKTPELLMTDRQGIEIDYCSTCRGVWLDRGELDKLIDRATEESAQSTVSQPAAILSNAGVERRRDERTRYDDHDRRDDEYRERRHPYKRKKSMLGELFDFG